MSDRLVNRLLGGGGMDPGCEACFEVLDAYAEAVLRGADVDRLFSEVVAHNADCAACREDTEGLIAALRALEPPEESR
jgi:hypothetical protein